MCGGGCSNNHFAIYTDIKLLCYTPETYTILQVNCISIKWGKIKELDMLLLKICGGNNRIWTEVMMKKISL